MSDLKKLAKIFAAAFLFGLFIVWVSRISQPVPDTWAWQPTGEIEQIHPEEKMIEIIADKKQFRFIPSTKNEQINDFTWRYIYPADNGALREIVALVSKNIDEKLTDRGASLLVLVLRDGLAVKVELPTMKLLAESRMAVYSDSGSVNMLLAANAIDGTVLNPGEEFSFNRIVGPRTSERGYVESVSIYGDSWVPDVGGGVCRTSTLLHQAVKTAGLKVVEKTNHGLPVSYAAPGEDATVAWGALDYRFLNNLNRKIIINFEQEDNQLVARLSAF